MQMIFGKGSDDFALTEEMKPTVICPLVVWRTNEEEIKKIVRSSELLPAKNISPIVSNNQLILTMSAIDVINLGYCSFEPEFAQLVREGKTDRKTWLYAFELLEFATLRGFLKRDIETSLAKLGLTLNDVVKPTK
jgi:hypothetical protein